MEHFFVMRPDNDFTVNYSFLAAGKWMSEEELKDFEFQEVQFKIMDD